MGRGSVGDSNSTVSLTAMGPLGDRTMTVAITGTQMSSWHTLMMTVAGEGTKVGRYRVSVLLGEIDTWVPFASIGTAVA